MERCMAKWKEFLCDKFCPLGLHLLCWCNQTCTKTRNVENFKLKKLMKYCDNNQDEDTCPSKSM